MAPNTKKKRCKSNIVGRKLIKEVGKRHLNEETSEHAGIIPFVSGDSQKHKVTSVAERSALDEFLDVALSAQSEHIDSKTIKLLVTQASDEHEQILYRRKNDFSGLYDLGYVCAIPRRPEVGENLNEAEIKAFIQWRVKIASLEEKENACFTPYERNLEYWRQLWRVMEKSSVVVQVIDARNPLFFWSKDVAIYANELNTSKQVLLLLNKADLIPIDIRKYWLKYFSNLGIHCCLFNALEQKNPSALVENQNLKKDDTECEISSNALEVVDKNTDLSRIITLSEMQNNCLETDLNFSNAEKVSRFSDFSTTLILSVTELLCVLKRLTENQVEKVVGFVGFPNVGKSSVINSLLGKKLVSMSEQPGKTRHFQTHSLPSVGIILCDSPGLIFPQRIIHKAFLVVNGIVSVDRSRGSMLAPIQIICDILGEELLRKYGLSNGKNKSQKMLTALNFLTALSKSRHHTSGGKGGQADLIRMARLVIKDFQQGRLLWYTVPSTMEPHSSFCESKETTLDNNNTDIEDEEKLLFSEIFGTPNKKILIPKTKRHLRFLKKHQLRNKIVQSW